VVSGSLQRGEKKAVGNVHVGDLRLVFSCTSAFTWPWWFGCWRPFRSLDLCAPG
jgi:hypothetical protein